MMRTGGVEFLGRQVSGMAQGNFRLAQLSSSWSVAVMSAFINNTPVVILFIPVVMAMCCEFGLSPSKFLIPVSYASILAGTCTLIGTSTNIIISDLSHDYGYGRHWHVRAREVGFQWPSAVAFLYFAAPRFSHLANPICQTRGERTPTVSCAELRSPRGQALIGRVATELFRKRYPKSGSAGNHQQRQISTIPAGEGRRAAQETSFW